MLSDTQRREAAEALRTADRARKPIPQLSRTYPGMTLEDAYAVQGLWAQALIHGGSRRVGTKIGLTSRAMQMASGITEPDYGFLMDDMLYNDGAQIAVGRFMAPRLEVELAFVMGEDLEGPTARVHDVMRATQFVVPALEIIDYRTETPRQIVDTISDNAAAAGWPITAAETPDSSMTPFLDRVAPTQRTSTSNGRTVRPPTTMAAAAALSAMVSTI